MEGSTKAVIVFINVESITFFDTVLEYMDSFLLQAPTLNISQKLLDGTHSGIALF
jgi:hypothetical protein